MTDVWELAAYVEAHPTNHEQRWRLAKKLYTSFEYRLALEHLLLLKNETEPRENIMRYLAATYYRLGRHEEAVKALEEALAVWPKDVGLREQLARSQAEAGNHVAALKSWREVHKLAPDHPFAEQAIARLKTIVDREAAEKYGLTPPLTVAAPGMAAGDQASPPAAETACPKCGEKNSADFKKCWRCSAPLMQGPDFLDDVIKKAERTEPAQVPWPIMAGLVLAGLFAVGVYFTLRGMARVSEAQTGNGPPADVFEALDQTLLWTRVLLGAVLLVAWPFVWRFAAYVANTGNRIYDETIYQAGAFLALSTFALLWLPWKWIIAAAIAPALLSALIAFAALKLPPRLAAKLWLTQLGIAAALVLAVVAARNGPGLLLEAPKIADFARENRAHQPFDATVRAPGALRVQWHSTGSTWLDQRINRARLTLQAPPTGPRVYLEATENGKRLSYEQIARDEHTSNLDALRTAVDYTFSITGGGPAEADVTLTIDSLLPFTAESAPAKP